MTRNVGECPDIAGQNNELRRELFERFRQELLTANIGFDESKNGAFGGDDGHFCMIIGEIPSLPEGAELYTGDSPPEDAWVAARLFTDVAGVICHGSRKVVTKQYLKNKFVKQEMAAKA